MIFQGLFNILDLYFNEIDLFYANIDQLFREKIRKYFDDFSVNGKNIKHKFKEFTLFIKKILIDLGFEESEIENEFVGPYFEIRQEESTEITSIFSIYKKKFAPIIYEILLEKIPSQG